MSGGPGNGATVFPLKLLLPDQLLLDLLLLLCLQRHHQNKDWNDHRFLDTESAGAVLTFLFQPIHKILTQLSTFGWAT